MTSEPAQAMFCLGCGGELSLSDAPQCPRCQRRFKPDSPTSYTAVPYDASAWTRAQRRERALRWLILSLGLLAVIVFAALMFFAALGPGETPGRNPGASPGG